MYPRSLNRSSGCRSSSTTSSTSPPATRAGTPLEKERVDLGGLVKSAVDKGKARAAEKGQKLEAEIRPATGHVFGDARRLREAVEHVLQNAIAYTDRKGRITLIADGDKENALISIRDNGTGIAAKDLPRVFNRFDRVLEAGVRGEAALGLGLPLTRQFIEAHGGTVDLQSKKGRGTIVTLTIPRGVKMILQDEAATARLGAALARVARATDIITLSGPLGVGKTALARGFIAALGHSGEVPSPSFTIVQPYEELDPPVWHVDLYRIEDAVGARRARSRFRGGVRASDRMAGTGGGTFVARRARAVARVRRAMTTES